jgi:Flp pilus assembly protein TadD
MAYAYSSEARPRRRMALALLAITIVAAMLGGCTQTGLPFAGKGEETKLSATDAVGAIAQWSAAYAKNPQDPKMALGYAAALKAIGSRDRALEVLVAAYRGNQINGEISAELGRLALDMGRLDIATQTLKTAETQGVKDWKTLSAQGTLCAKQGKYAEAQQYFLAALQEQPDAVSVINNLALSYALDRKADKSEELLRKAVASGHDDKRVRQNLALVLGLQGKFGEARQVASVDMTEQEAKSSLTYLRNMLSSQTQLAAAGSGDADDHPGDDWQPFSSNDAKGATSNNNPAATPAVAPKVKMVKAAETVEAPSTTAPVKAAQAASPQPSAKPGKVGVMPTLITPVRATSAQVQAAAPPSDAQGAPTGLLRPDID